MTLAALVAVAMVGDPGVGDRWQPFQMLNASGRTVEWRPGRVTVFSVCAFWCDTWKTQVPKLVEARGALSGLPVDFVTVSTDGRWAEVAKNNGGLALWRDAGGTWSRATGITRVPTTVVVDPSGKVVFSSGGIVRRDELLPAVRSALSRRSADGGPLYLTFDDFPHLAAGEELLDVLRATGVKATLFCLGSRLQPQAKLIQRAAREGHSVQCHSWDHDSSRPQLERCRQAFQQVLGTTFRLYRGPGSETIVGLQKTPPVVDPYDFERPGRAELERRVLAAVRGGSQIQLHAGVRETLEALPDLIQTLRKRGFSFEKL